MHQKEQIPLVGDAYTSLSPQFSSQTCVNFYPAINQQGEGGKYGSLLYPTPGLFPLYSFGLTGSIRWMASVLGKMYVVHDQGFYEFDPITFSVQVRGTLNTTQGIVRHCYNNTQIQLVDGVNGYVYTPSSHAFAVITDAQYNPTKTVCFQDGYGISILPGTNAWQLSKLNDLSTYTPTAGITNVSAFGVSGDNLVTALSSHLELFLIGDTRIEIWQNQGATPFPFLRVPGVLIEQGCVAQYSACLLDNTLYWLGKNELGGFSVYRAYGFAPQPVSNEAIESIFNSYQTVVDAQAFAYQFDGHKFYVLTFPTANATWVYDAITGKWHQWSTTDVSGGINRHKSNAYCFHNTKPYIGDSTTGQIYLLSGTTYTDGTLPIIRERTWPTITNLKQRTSIYSIEVECEVGTGLSSGQGTYPRLMGQFSRDGGKTWGAERWANLGSTGNFKTRAIWYRLGSGRNLTIRTRISDPVYTSLFAAIADISKDS